MNWATELFILTARLIFTAIVCLGLGSSLAACNQNASGVRIVNGGTSAIPAKEGAKILDFGPAEVANAISGKTFQYTRKTGNGFVTYNSDGTFNFQDDAAGEGVGKWRADGAKYCEVWGKAEVECGVFKNTGDAYFAANSRLVEMKI